MTTYSIPVTQNTASNVFISTGTSTVPGYGAIPGTYSQPTLVTTTGTSPYVSIGDTNSRSSLRVTGDAEFEGNIMVGGSNLTEILEKIQERLAIIQFSKELEAEFDELRILGDRYRELEAKIQDQKRVWDILKSK